MEFDVVCFLIPSRVNRGLSDRTILLFRFESLPGRSDTVYKYLDVATLGGCGTQNNELVGRFKKYKYDIHWRYLSSVILISSQLLTLTIFKNTLNIQY